MKKYLFMMLVAALGACHQHAGHQHAAKPAEEAAEGNFGEAITPEGAATELDYAVMFTDADMAEFKITGDIAAACQHSGCWMDVTLADGETVHVTFLDDGFTIPLDAAGKTAVAEGTVFRRVVPVETLQNYAREDGKSEEEIAAITEPSYAYRFIAKGVIIQ